MMTDKVITNEFRTYALNRIGSCDEPCEECRWGRKLLEKVEEVEGLSEISPN